MIRPVVVSRLNQVLPTLNSLRPLTAPTRCPRPVFFATVFTSIPGAAKVVVTSSRYAVEIARLRVSGIPRRAR